MKLLVLLAVAASACASTTMPVKAKMVYQTNASWNGTKLQYTGTDACITAQVVEIAPGAETGWHSHPRPPLAYVLEGDLEVSLQDGRVSKLHAGDALVEVVGVMHNGRNVGSKPVKVLVFYVGSPGTKITTTAPLETTTAETPGCK